MSQRIWWDILGYALKNSSLHLFITLKYVEEINEIRLVKRWLGSWRIWRGSLLCMIGNLQWKARKSIKHLQGRCGKTQPGRDRLCHSKNKEFNTQVHARSPGALESTSSRTLMISRQEFSWACPGCSWNLQGMPSASFGSQSKAFYSIPLQLRLYITSTMSL